MKTFDYDVFLAHSSKDKPVVRALAKRLRADGLRVWLDEWIIQLGGSVPLKVSNGLERSRMREAKYTRLLTTREVQPQRYRARNGRG